MVLSQPSDIVVSGPRGTAVGDPAADRQPASSAWWRVRERSPLVVLALGLALFLGVVFPVIVSVWTGSYSIPHNDSWAETRAAENFARTGQIHLYNWNSMSLVGMYIPLWKLGTWITVQEIYTGLLAVVALAATFDILRDAGGRKRAAIGVLAMACWPGFGLLSTSFMTDIPALAAIAVTFALGRRALERASVPLFLAVTVVGFWGFTIREQGIAAPLGIYVAALWRPALLRRDKLPWLLGFGTGMAVAALVFEQWRRKVVNGEPPKVSFAQFPGWASMAHTYAGSWLVLALVLSPVILLTARPWAWSWPVRLVALAAFAWFAWDVHQGLIGIPQNYLEMNGAYFPAYLGLRPNLFPQPLWDILLPLGCLSSALLIGLVCERIRAVRIEFLVFWLVTAAFAILEISELWIQFDRYQLPLTIPVLTLLLKRGEPITRPQIGLAALTGAFIASVTGLIMMNALTFDAATWHSAQAVVADGKASAAHVDAGLDWTAWHSPDGYKKPYDPGAEHGIYEKSAGMGNDHPCYVVAASPQQQPGWSLYATHEYRRFGFIGPEQHTYVYRTAETVCGN
ncbi:hypothetical protein Caci_6826 [Catenulispora acidiphila DSM 44928]|uniref:Glycosyltransferase RgtA/B/C/D-like domain-containing protein n=1 Tax=Catenulispora acidiphila (strain DSM 44928 / JCM 14897 / NBRC 102108 / NRRL B-24433 / ID139908) TaxID=479433 RepID=C7Q1W6_CATAD|nr:hypothetical protein Caci_6826 [Catenulispora acidiphila DSM 44928]